MDYSELCWQTSPGANKLTNVPSQLWWAGLFFSYEGACAGTAPVACTYELPTPAPTPDATPAPTATMAPTMLEACKCFGVVPELLSASRRRFTRAWDTQYGKYCFAWDEVDCKGYWPRDLTLR